MANPAPPKGIPGSFAHSKGGAIYWFAYDGTAYQWLTPSDFPGGKGKAHWDLIPGNTKDGTTPAGEIGRGVAYPGVDVASKTSQSSPAPQPGPAPSTPPDQLVPPASPTRGFPPQPLPAPSPKGGAKWPSNLSSSLVSWLQGQQISPDFWDTTSQEERNHLRSLALRDGLSVKDTGYVNADQEKQFLKDNPQLANQKASKPFASGGTDKAPVTPPTPTPLADGAANAAGTIGGSAAQLADPFFYSFVQPAYMPVTDRYAKAAIDTLGSHFLGRGLRPDEYAPALAAYRQFEHSVYMSDVQKAKSEWARSTVSAEQKARYDASLPNAAVRAPTSAQEKGVLGEAHADSGKDAMFTPYTADDMNLQMRDILDKLAPKEAMGEQMRSSIQGLMAAIQSQVSVKEFEQ